MKLPPPRDCDRDESRTRGFRDPEPLPAGRRREGAASRTNGSQETWPGPPRVDSPRGGKEPAISRLPPARRGAAGGPSASGACSTGGTAAGPTVTLITGGARSGKSRYALASAEEAGRRRVYVATAEPLDEEMRRRIERHRAERGAGWSTIEEPIDLAGALARLAPETEVAVVDCLTVWLGNLVHRSGLAGAADLADPETFPEIAAFLALLDAPPCPLLLVTNELGWGIVPDNALARAFRDLAGRVNEEAARRADRVVLMVAGRPLELPGGRGG